MVWRLVRLMRDVRPDIVHTRNWGTIDGIIAARIAGISKVVHGEHGWNMDDPWGQNPKRLFARRLLGFGVNRFVALSEDIKQWLYGSSRIPLDKIVKIINGVDAEKFLPEDGGARRDSLGIYTDEVVIGIVARLDPIKRHDLLLRAFLSLDHDRYKLRLLVVGDGPVRVDLEQLMAGLLHSDKIIFTGERDDINSLYNAIDIFVLPSRNEGISNTILEAMSSGLPVVATSVGGNRELVSEGETGQLILPDSVEAIKNALNCYLENRELMVLHGRNARKEVLRRYSLKHMISQYESLYANLFNR